MKYNIIYFIYFLIFLFLIGCSKSNVSVDGVNVDNTKTEIKRITIYTAEENSENIWCIGWPGYYCAGTDYIHFDENIPKLSEEETEYLISYVESIPKPNENADDSNCICRIYLSVNTGNCNSSVCGSVYGDYPEGKDEFCKIINNICGGDKEYLNMNGNMQEMTDEYFTVLTGYTDDMISGGTIRDVIEHLGIDNTVECYPYFLKNWYYQDILNNYELCRLLPYKICSVPSTDDECYEYAKLLADELGVTSAITKNGSEFAEQEWYEFEYNQKIVRVYRTELVSKDIENRGGVVDSDTQCYKIFERVDYGELEGGNVLDFVYSNDCKFAAAVEYDYKDNYKTIYEVGTAARKID